MEIRAGRKKRRELGEKEVKPERTITGGGLGVRNQGLGFRVYLFQNEGEARVQMSSE